MSPSPLFTRPARRALTIAAVAAAVFATCTATASAAVSGFNFVGGQAIAGVSDKYLADFERGIGRKANLVRVYYQMNHELLNARDRDLAAGGRMLHVSIKAENSSGMIKYSRIAAGDYDAYFLRSFKAMAALNKSTFFSFQHEADADGAQGSCSQPGRHSVCGPEFIKAWNRLRNLAKNNGYDKKIIWVWTLTGHAWRPAVDRADYYYPGNATVDWIGNDTYSSAPNGECPNNEALFQDTAAKYVNAWVKQVAPNKPVMMPETAGRRDSFQDDYANSLRSGFKDAGWSNWKAFQWWNSGTGDCTSQVSNNPTAMVAVKALYNDPFFLATNVTRSTTSTSTTTTTTTTTTPTTTTAADSVAITSPSAGATVAGTINIAVKAQDADGIESVQLRVDNEWAQGDDTAAYSFSYDTRQLSNGTHTFEVRMWDLKGNMIPASITLNVQN